MPNARDAHPLAAPKFFMLGNTGSGKTTQFLTLPGKKFIYLFDPNALLSIKGYDIDYEEFLPDVLSMDIYSLSKDKTRQKVMSTRGADVYQEWEKDIEAKLASDFFKSYDWVGVDSFTTLSDMVMDSVLLLNGRPGRWPQEDDYAPQMNALTNITRTFAALGKPIYFTGHVEVKQDELTKQIFYTPLMTGRLRVKLPLLFSEILYLKADSDGKNVRYNLQTKPDRMMPLIRTSMKGLDPLVDTTLDFTKPLEGQGLGRVVTASRSV